MSASGGSAGLGVAATIAAAVSAALVALLLAVSGTVAQTSQGQVGAPIPLRPSPTEAKPETVPAPKPGAIGGVRGDTRILRSTRPSGSVEIRRLEAFDPSSVGLLSEADGGLGLEMWAGSRLSSVKRLLPRLPMGTASPVMQSLARRLLLTTARLPEGAGNAAQGASLLALRIDRLAAGGHLGEISELLALAPSVLGEIALIGTRMNAMWLEGDEAGACVLARNLVERSDDPMWQKSMALCHALEGESVQAELLEQLLAEAEHEDQVFYAAIGALLGRGGEPLKSLPAPEPLHVAMLRSVGWSLPEDALVGARPMVLRTIVGSENVPQAMRIEAAERAVSMGALPVDALREIYRQATYSDEERQAPEALAEREPGARGNGLLFQVARAANQPIARTNMLALTLRNARLSGRYATVARANAAALKSIVPVPGLVWFAAEAGRGLLAAGDLERAMGWLIMVSRDSSASGRMAAETLWPLLLVADDRGRVPFDTKRFSDWWQTQAAVPKADLVRRAGLLLTVVEALDQRVPPGAWEVLYDEAGHTAEVTPSPALIQGLGKAADAVRTGETVLLALVALGPGGPARAAPATLALVIAALKRLGLEVEARAVGLEAMLAQDF